MRCPNQDLSRLRLTIVLPFRPVRGGIREISAEKSRLATIISHLCAQIGIHDVEGVEMPFTDSLAKPCGDLRNHWFAFEPAGSSKRFAIAAAVLCCAMALASTMSTSIATAQDASIEKSSEAATSTGQVPIDPTIDHYSVMYLWANKKNCTCYLSSDCGSGQTCQGYFGCKVNPQVKNNDGTCKKSGGGGFWPTLDLTLAAQSAQLYFLAYLTAGQNGGGYPDVDLMRRAQSVPLSVKAHQEVQSLVNDSLDIVLGFDLLPPQPQYGTMMRQVPPFKERGISDAADLVSLMSIGVVKAIQANDPDLVANPIREFWRLNPDFAPLHIGRCYPHGHEAYAYQTAEECQVNELTRLLAALLSKRGEQ